MPKIDIDARPTASGSPIPRRSTRLRERKRWQLGDAAGLDQFGVNLQRLPPGAWTSQRHWHTAEDEFVWVVEGEVVLVDDEGETCCAPATARASRPASPTATTSRTARTRGGAAGDRHAAEPRTASTTRHRHGARPTEEFYRHRTGRLSEK
jgi:hypothetical protein